MVPGQSRRGFLSDVGRGTLMATIGPALAMDLGLTPAVYAGDAEPALHFGDFEPLVALLQETPVERLQRTLVTRLKEGVSLKTLVAAGALANARTFGGEDYIGFHTFMALSPAYRMSAMMSSGAEALPVFKVLYRNSSRIQEYGGRAAETLQELSAANAAATITEAALQQAVRSRNTDSAEQMLSGIVAINAQSGLDALIPIVQEYPEVHRTVLPYRAWDMQELVGPSHALTLLRQSLRYCVKAQPQQNQEISETGRMLVEMLDQHKLAGLQPGQRPVDDDLMRQLSGTFATAAPLDAARAAASALAEGFQPEAIGEAISLAASLLVLRDRGRLPQWEDALKPAGSVHGDSVGVHASDSANAWRNLARVSSGRNVFACLIVGAWQVARDRDVPGNLMDTPLPVKYHLDRLVGLNGDGLLARLDDAIRNNLQAHATAIVQRYAELSLPPEPVFQSLLKYAVSEDGALHAEKYFHTVWDDFHATRPSMRWQHLTALSRVTASEFGKPAAGQAEAREILQVI